MGEAKADNDALDQAEVTICDSCLCLYTGFATGAQCLGCMESNACLCLECEFCCKSGVEPLCLYCCALRKIDITVLCKGQAQCCCLVGAGAIPCDDEVPMMFGTLGLTCYPKVGCCMKMKDITA